jgi:hypothetical protein
LCGVVTVATLDTVNAIIQSMRFSVFDDAGCELGDRHPLRAALLVSTY